MKNNPKKPLIIIGAIVLVIFGVIAWAISTGQKNTPVEPPVSPEQNSSYNVTDRGDSEYTSRIKKAYPYLSSVNLTVVNKELVQPHWYIVTTHEGDTKIPFKYIFYDDRPNSEALSLAAIGLDQPELPQAANIPEDVLKQVDGGGL